MMKFITLILLIATLGSTLAQETEGRELKHHYGKDYGKYDGGKYDYGKDDEEYKDEDEDEYDYGVDKEDYKGRHGYHYDEDEDYDYEDTDEDECPTYCKRHLRKALFCRWEYRSCRRFAYMFQEYGGGHGYWKRYRRHTRCPFECRRSMRTAKGCQEQYDECDRYDVFGFEI